MILSFPQGGPWMASLTENVNPNSLAPYSATIGINPGVQLSTCKVDCIETLNFVW